jgi:hypothetical protein
MFREVPEYLRLAGIIPFHDPHVDAGLGKETVALALERRRRINEGHIISPHELLSN